MIQSRSVYYFLDTSVAACYFVFPHLMDGLPIRHPDITSFVGISEILCSSNSSTNAPVPHIYKDVRFSSSCFIAVFLLPKNIFSTLGGLPIGVGCRCCCLHKVESAC